MKILVIEDEHKIANSIKKGLEQEHFLADVAYDGENGFDMSISQDYDLLILDRLLPKMDGIEICKKLREKDIHTPIILLTAKGQTEDKIEGLNAGADDYLTKPFAFEELLARINALLRRPKYIKSLVLKVADLTLDQKEYKVTRENKEISLSQKEFMLLEYLMRYSGKIVKKEQLISSVWNYDSDILLNTVEVYIKHLREKIDNPFPDKKPLIHTVRGFGYKLKE